MSKKLIASMSLTICCAGFALIPMPFRQWANLRMAGAVGALASSIAGYCISNRKKERQLRYDKWQFNQQEEQRLIAEATRPIAIQTAVTKLQTQADYALADYKDDVSAAYTAVMIDKYGEDWVRSQLPQLEPEQVALPDPELAEIVEEVKSSKQSFAAKKAKLLKFITEHELGWIAQCMKKPILIYGDQGSGKSYFAEFLALCRHYLRGHQIISIADPHFHQNRDECWKQLAKLKVPGFGAHHNYQEVNSQILAMYDRFATRTLKSAPITSIFDEVTRYGQEATQESAAKLGSKLSSDPRKANESPILVAHAKTLAALGGGDGFADAIKGNFIIIKLNSNSEQEPLWRGTISGIKDEDGELIENMKISIAPEWIRSSWVYDLFNSDTEILETIPEIIPETETISETDSVKLDRIMGISEDYWKAESNPEMLDRLKQEWLSELGNGSDNLPDNLPDNAQDKPDNFSDKLSQSDNLIQTEITLEALPRETYPIIWNADDFARLLPNDSESALFERILGLSDKYKSASKIIQQGLGFTQGKRKPKSYSDVGKPCFKYIVRKHGTPSLIANFKDYLEKD
ncbi:MAG: ATP-binding protein [Microcoleus sp.]